MAKLKLLTNQRGEGEYYEFKCPGCGDTHVVTVNGAAGEPKWGYNGNIAAPTFSPSLLVTSGKYVQGNENFDDEGLVNVSYRCHSFIRDGQIEFLADCTHALAGNMVPLKDI